MSWLVFDCPSGISGDMTLGALVDLGVPLDHLRAALATLPLHGYALGEERVQRSSITATRVHVEIESAPPGGGRTFESGHAQAHADKHGKQPAHPHRHLHDVVEILEAGKLSERALGWAVEVFRRLAMAEAAVHGVSIGQVHFHEVGAVDAIVDIAGTCVGLDWVCSRHDVRGIRVSQIRVGRGKVRTEHGMMPVPPPATLRLLEGFPIQWSDVDGERVTPTGAAILAALARPLAGVAVSVRTTGYGAGTHEYADVPNVLRLVLCDPEKETAGTDLPPGAPVHDRHHHDHDHDHDHDHEHGPAHHHGSAPAPAETGEHAAGVDRLQRGRVAVINTTIDDMVPEFYGHLMSKLFAAGALDVVYTPVFMKKERPATLVTVIAAPQDAESLAAVLLNESSTLGVRISHEERLELERRSATVRTPFGDIQVKVAVRPDGGLRVTPEYESVRLAAEKAGVPLADVYQAALSARAQLGEERT